MNPNNEMARRHLDAKFAELKNLSNFTRPPKGWIKAIRNALGMTTTQLAKRLNVTQPRIIAIEKNEPIGNLKLSTLENIANALDCELVYALVPRQGLEKMAYNQAELKAKLLLQQAEHTMELENQASSIKKNASQLEKLIQEFLKGSQSRLWDDV